MWVFVILVIDTADQDVRDLGNQLIQQMRAVSYMTNVIPDMGEHRIVMKCFTLVYLQRLTITAKLEEMLQGSPTLLNYGIYSFSLLNDNIMSQYNFAD